MVLHQQVVAYTRPACGAMFITQSKYLYRPNASVYVYSSLSVKLIQSDMKGAEWCGGEQVEGGLGEIWKGITWNLLFYDHSHNKNPS